MLRPLHLVLLLLVVVLVAAIEKSADPARAEAEPQFGKPNDLNADATYYAGYYGRYGWNGYGYNGWGGRGWFGRFGGWW